MPTEGSETARVRDELEAAGVSVYRNRTVRVGADPRSDRWHYETPTGRFDTLKGALDAIDAALPVEEYVTLKVNMARGGYRPDEVAALVREAIDFGVNRGRLGTVVTPAGGLAPPVERLGY